MCTLSMDTERLLYPVPYVPLSLLVPNEEMLRFSKSGNDENEKERKGMAMHSCSESWRPSGG